MGLGLWLSPSSWSTQTGPALAGLHTPRNPIDNSHHSFTTRDMRQEATMLLLPSQSLLYVFTHPFNPVVERSILSQPIPNRSVDESMHFNVHVLAVDERVCILYSKVLQHLVPALEEGPDRVIDRSHLQ